MASRASLNGAYLPEILARSSALVAWRGARAFVQQFRRTSSAAKEVHREQQIGHAGPQE
jgi:hypothetical protein